MSAASVTFSRPVVTILGSGVHLGVYIPALLVRSRLIAHGVNAEVIVLEECYKPEHLERLPALRKLFHDNFAAALTAHRMVRDVRSSLDTDRVKTLLDQWEKEHRRHFIMWSGFWMPVIEEYRQRFPSGTIQIDLCRIDAVVSATFKAYEDIDISSSDYREIWLWSKAENRLIYGIPVTGHAPVSYGQRDKRCVVHGGGWGIGTYQSKIAELDASGLDLDIVAYAPQEAQSHPRHRYFMVDPEWRAWHKKAGESLEFPPFGRVGGASIPRFINRTEHHELFDIVRYAQAIISKPGGGTLIDSLASATPLILLEPYGYAEQANADVWESLGCGIPYQKWLEAGCDQSLLEPLYNNLLAYRSQILDYPKSYADRLAK